MKENKLITIFAIIGGVMILMAILAPVILSSLGAARDKAMQEKTQSQ